MTGVQVSTERAESHIHLETRTGLYRDSVALMRLSGQLRGAAGVRDALVAMATPLNLELLAGLGFPTPEGAGANDLVVAVRASGESALRDALASLEAGLAERPGPGSDDGFAPAQPARTTASAAARDTSAAVALVSVPGQYAFVEAVDALEAGLHPMIFSDNLPVEQERALKRLATERGLLVLGPDCGTAVIDGVGLGFANAVRRGPVGLVAASGTGAQQLMCLLDAAEVGISHCLGVGGRDLSAAVGGAATRQALRLLDADPGTELVVLVSKVPEPAVAAEVAGWAAELATPVVLAFLGAGCVDLTGAAEEVLVRLGRAVPRWPSWLPAAKVAPASRAGALRALYSGGTLCQEALTVLGPALGAVASNTGAGLPGVRSLSDSGRSGHLAVDFGADEYTAGRAHPMIDPTVLLAALAAELADPAVGVVLLDVVLGHGAHPDPAAGIVRTLGEADRTVPVVAALVGTGGDPQSVAGQAEALRAAGVRVFASNAEAARTAAGLVGGGG